MELTPLDSKIMLENSRVLLLPFESERKSELKKIIFNYDIWCYMGMNIETESDFKQYVHETLELKKKVHVILLLLLIKKQMKWLEVLALATSIRKVKNVKLNGRGMDHNFKAQG